MGTNYVIIGAGPAAQAAAASIRMYDKLGTIKMITREETAPYSPVALPYLISGELTATTLFRKGINTVNDLNVELVTGKAVSRINKDDKEITFTDGSALSFDKLLVATGATPAVAKIEGLSAEDTLVFRTYQDYEKLTKKVRAGGRIVIYGAGLVAVELSEKLKSAGYEVVIVVRSYLLRKYFSRELVARLEALYAAEGIRILSGTTIAGCEKTGEGYLVKLSSGDTMPADAIILATGVTANTFAGLAAENGGIKVDNSLRTECEDIYAAGDVAAVPYSNGSGFATCPISPEAVRQGKLAGRNMAGEAGLYTGAVSSNYLRVFEENLFSIGEIEGQTEMECTVLRNDTMKLLFHGDQLVGVEAIGMKAVHPGIFQFIISQKIPVSGDDQKLLLDKPKETAAWLMRSYRNHTL